MTHPDHPARDRLQELNRMTDEQIRSEFMRRVNATNVARGKDAPFPDAGPLEDNGWDDEGPPEKPWSPARFVGTAFAFFAFLSIVFLISFYICKITGAL